MLFWLGENRSRATFDALFQPYQTHKMALTFDLDLQIILKRNKFNYGIWFERIDSKIIKFEQVGPAYMSFYRFETRDWRPSWKYAK